MAVEEKPILELRRSCLSSTAAFDTLANDESRDYYVSLDWSPEFYVLQASRGFIAVATTIASSGLELLLPQLQFSYCVLRLRDKEPVNWRSVTRRSRDRSYRIRINHAFNHTIHRIREYHGEKSWLSHHYTHLMETLYNIGPVGSSNFQICSVELYDTLDILVAGEIGYIIGSVFTSLSGFSVRSRS